MKLKQIEKKLEDTYYRGYEKELLIKLHTLRGAIEKFKNHMDEYLVDQDIDPTFQELYKSLEDL